MKRVVAWTVGAAVAMGGPGLFLIALLDSSFLSFPEMVDLLLMGLVTHHKERMVFYALMATVGSIVGCFVLYAIGRKGGEAFLRKRLHERHVDRALAIFQRYGLLAVAVPAILPPPVPFKPFVLAAGVAEVRPLEFLLAVALGRGVRYFGEAVLAVWYGDRAAAFLRDNARSVGLTAALLVLAAALAWTIWHRTSRTRGAARQN